LVLSVSNPVKHRILVEKYNVNPEELTKKLASLYLAFYHKKWKFCDVRSVLPNSGTNDISMSVRMKMAFRFAGFKEGEKVYCRIVGRDIVIRKDWYGYPTSMEVGEGMGRVVLTPMLMALGYKVGDLVLVLSREGEVVIRDFKLELRKLEIFEKKTGVCYVGKARKVRSNIVEDSVDTRREAGQES